MATSWFKCHHLLLGHLSPHLFIGLPATLGLPLQSVPYMEAERISKCKFDQPPLKTLQWLPCPLRMKSQPNSSLIQLLLDPEDPLCPQPPSLPQLTLFHTGLYAIPEHTKHNPTSRPLHMLVLHLEPQTPSYSYAGSFSSLRPQFKYHLFREAFPPSPLLSILLSWHLAQFVTACPFLHLIFLTTTSTTVL